MDRPLTGLAIAVTRPAGQNEALMRQIEYAGGKAIAYPTLTILPADTAWVPDIAARLDAFDVAIFISANAVAHGLKPLLARRAWHNHIAVAAMGPGGAGALSAAGFDRVVLPNITLDSEGLLTAEAFAPDAINGRKVIIFRGSGGREVLAESLRARGALVEYVECYRRTLPEGDAADPAALVAAHAAGLLHGIVASSSEGLKNLQTLLAEAPWVLNDTTLFVPHPRIAAYAETLGLEKVVTTPPADAGLLSGMIKYFQNNPRS